MHDFNYHEPRTLAEAAAALRTARDGRFIAGGMSLIPALKQRRTKPSDLIDLRLIEGLSGLRREGNAVVIGAMTRHADVADSALLRAADENAEERIKAILEGDPRLNVTVLREDRYYAAQMVSALPIEFFGYTICLIMGVGSSFAAMNTMYASISARNREIGTLRALGFSRASILFSFVFEAASLSLAGGILACLLVLPLNLITTELGSVTTFSQSIFKIDIGPLPMMAGLGFSILLGAAGGFLPAWQASRKGILAALREG